MTLSNGHLDPLPGNPIQPVVEPPENTETVKISSFEQGLINGLIGIDTDTYEAFITHSEQKKLESVRLKKIREQAAKNEEERGQVKTSLLSLHQTIQEREGQIQNSEARISKRERDRRRMKEQQGHWESVKQQQIIDYSVISACFFVMIGGLFLFTDLYISKDVAKNALGIDNVDAWIFASGLAGIAFVFKFAVDRIFEKPFREEGKKLRMTLFLIVISVGAILTLGFAGYIRNEGALVAVYSGAQNEETQDKLTRTLDGGGKKDVQEKGESLVS
ncbi:MAG: hypothetical protein KDC44_18475, partial [Phaeodactylibacter sp.]|nr:hypothetical protein [Phaeodactylibacter sp.]